ncbi:T9SS type A sorting domain-containing protein [Bacteroidota bacterium]
MKKYYPIILLIYILKTTLCFGQNNMAVSPSGYLTSIPPETPILLAPTDLSENLSDTIILHWQSQIHVSYYSLQVSEESDFIEPVINKSILSDTTFLVLGLDNNTTYYWHVNASNVAGESIYSPVWSFVTASATGIDWEIESMHDNFILQPPYPNPFHSYTTIKYEILGQTEVVIAIYNILGQPVRKLISEKKQTGKYKVTWDGRNDNDLLLPDGLYICVILNDKDSISRTFLLKR